MVNRGLLGCFCRDIVAFGNNVVAVIAGAVAVLRLAARRAAVLTVGVAAAVRRRSVVLRAAVSVAGIVVVMLALVVDNLAGRGVYIEIVLNGSGFEFNIVNHHSVFVFKLHIKLAHGSFADSRVRKGGLFGGFNAHIGFFAGGARRGHIV